MRLLTVIFPFALLFVAVRAKANERSYGELAKTRVVKALQTVNTELETLDEDFLPHETKTLRKLIASFRFVRLIAPKIRMGIVISVPLGV